MCCNDEPVALEAPQSSGLVPRLEGPCTATRKIPQGTTRIPCAATKTYSQINALKKKEYGKVYYNILPPSVGDILVGEDRLSKSILTCQLVGGARGRTGEGDREGEHGQS